jgi:hypothetical protein
MLRNGETVREDADESIDPLADLLFGLVAIIIPIFALLLPTIRMAANSIPTPNTEAVSALVRTNLHVDGAPARPFTAGARGISVPGESPRLVALADILDDRPLAMALARLRQQGQPLILLIEPDGHESAFLFETVVAAHGPAKLVQVRIEQGCAFVRNEELKAQCLGHAMRRVPRP